MHRQKWKKTAESLVESACSPFEFIAVANGKSLRWLHVWLLFGVPIRGERGISYLWPPLIRILRCRRENKSWSAPRSFLFVASGPTAFRSRGASSTTFVYEAGHDCESLPEDTREYGNLPARPRRREFPRRPLARLPCPREGFLLRCQRAPIRLPNCRADDSCKKRPGSAQQF